MKAVPTEAIRVLLVILNLFLPIWKLTWYNIDSQNGIKWYKMAIFERRYMLYCYIHTSVNLWFQHVQTSHTPQTQWNGIFTTFSRSASKKSDSFTWNSGPQPVLMAGVPHFSIASYPSQNLPSSSGRHSGIWPRMPRHIIFAKTDALQLTAFTFKIRSKGITSFMAPSDCTLRTMQ